MGAKLKTPPLIEALCEFRYASNSPWDWTIPGQMFEKIKNEFSERSQVQSVGVQLQASPRVPPLATIQTGPERVQLKRADGSAMVQVGPNLLAVNHLRPYPTWDVFRGLILNMLETYRGIVGTIELQRIGLRYINLIPLPKPKAELSDFITLSPPLTGQLDRTLKSFYQRYELQQDNPEGVLIHQTGIQTDDEGQPVIVLDLDFGSEQVQKLTTTESVKQWLEAAHDRVYEAFMASLNAELYEGFKRGTE